MGVNGQLHTLVTHPRARTSSAHWIADRVHPKASLDAVVKRKDPIITPAGD